jgi:hypothetical protein
MDDRSLVSWGLELPQGKETELKIVNNKTWGFYENKDQSIAPYFTNEMLERVHRKKACNVIVVGEAGIWKSYCAAQICRHIYPRFKVEHIVYHYSNYYELILNKRFKIGAPIMIDEPQDVMDHRDWFEDVQKALIKSITSIRFLGHPLVIAIINPSLIDKTIRDYLVQYQVECIDRGFARVFRLSPSLKEDKTYYNHICDLRYGLMDNDLCDRDSCLDCPKEETCQIFRAKYERGKRLVQFPKYEQSKQEAYAKESKTLTLDEIINAAYPLREYYTNSEGRIDVKKLRMILHEPPNHIILGHNKAYDVKTLLEYRYREVFKGNI